MRGWSLSLAVVALSVLPAGGQEAALREGRSALRQGWLERVEHARQQSAAFVGAAVDVFRLRDVGPRPGRRPERRNDGPATPALPVGYLDDPTLRHGDVIALPGKLVVFRGAPGVPHKPADFEELERAKTLVGTHERELRALDRTLAREAANEPSAAHASDRASAR